MPLSGLRFEADKLLLDFRSWRISMEGENIRGLICGVYKEGKDKKHGEKLKTGDAAKLLSALLATSSTRRRCEN